MAFALPLALGVDPFVTFLAFLAGVLFFPFGSWTFLGRGFLRTSFLWGSFGPSIKVAVRSIVDLAIVGEVLVAGILVHILPRTLRLHHRSSRSPGGRCCVVFTHLSDYVILIAVICVICFLLALLRLFHLLLGGGRLLFLLGRRSVGELLLAIIATLVALALRGPVLLIVVAVGHLRLGSHHPCQVQAA